MSLWSERCPAKLNLYLAVTGRRQDGFHDLVSLVAQTDFGDSIEADRSHGGVDTLVCDREELDCGPDNLVLRAAAAYRRRVPEAPYMIWNLRKRIPSGAGMGGGSSDAAAVLRLLNRVCYGELDDAAMTEVAAEIGSDCPLFLSENSCIMRGRGELVEPLPETVAASLRGRSVVVVKPHFGIPTPWAYGSLDRLGGFISPEAAEIELSEWMVDPSVEPPSRNSFQPPVFDKYACYGALNAVLVAAGLPELRLTGSGSACYAFAEKGRADAIISLAGDMLGEGSFATSARLL